MNQRVYEDSPRDAIGANTESDGSQTPSPSRRSFLQSALAAAGLVLVQELKAFPETAVLQTTQPAATIDLVHDTLNGLSAFVAGILNQTALGVNPAPVGPFDSPFANFSFNEKVIVFQSRAPRPLARALLTFYN
jgi:hypothetical protein